MSIEGNRIKGAAIHGYFKYVKKKWGEKGLADCVAAYGIAPKDVKPGGWYLHKPTDRIFEWIANEKGEEFLVECGAHTIKDLGMLSYVVRFMDPETILKKARASYQDAFNYGDLKVTINGKHAVIKLKDNTEGYKRACLVWEGVLKGILDMTRTRGTVKKVQCQTDGAPHCEFVMDWE